MTSGAALPPVTLDGKHLSLETIEAIAVDGAPVALTAEARTRVAAARECVERQFDAGAIIYGVTTGFGRMANVVIDPGDTARLQLNLVRSHSAGTGRPLGEDQVRAMRIAAGFARDHEDDRAAFGRGRLGSAHN